LLIFVVRSGANNSFCTHVTIRLLYKEICWISKWSSICLNNT
jgi:hypothetical protein